MADEKLKQEFQHFLKNVRPSMQKDLVASGELKAAVIIQDDAFKTYLGQKIAYGKESAKILAEGQKTLSKTNNEAEQQAIFKEMLKKLEDMKNKDPDMSAVIIALDKQNAVDPHVYESSDAEVIASRRYDENQSAQFLLEKFVERKVKEEVQKDQQKEKDKAPDKDARTNAAETSLPDNMRIALQDYATGKHEAGGKGPQVAKADEGRGRSGPA